ncbi:MAG: PorP/SprF family type IX secretion system membrane protein [Candidatus Kariarchaeum pelagius]
MKMKKLFIISIFVLSSFIGNSQQDAIFSQYTYNPSAINPAHTGTSFSPEIFLSHKSQWVGLDGAPTFANFSFQSKGDIRKINWGLNITNDEIGPTVENNFALNISYAVPFNDDSFLSFGLKGSVNNMDVNFSLLDIYNPEDPLIMDNIDNNFVPNLGFGFHYVSEKIFAGFAIPQMFKTDHYEVNSDNLRLANERPHHYLTFGYVNQISNDVVLKSTMLMKWVRGVKRHGNLSVISRFYDSFDLGIGYDTYSSWNFLAAFKVFNNFIVGYTVDRPVVNFVPKVQNSHELFVKWTLNKNLLPKSILRRFQ